MHPSFLLALHASYLVTSEVPLDLPRLVRTVPSACESSIRAECLANNGCCWSDHDCLACAVPVTEEPTVYSYSTLLFWQFEEIDVQDALLPSPSPFFVFQTVSSFVKRDDTLPPTSTPRDASYDARDAPPIVNDDVHSAISSVVKGGGNGTRHIRWCCVRRMLLVGVGVLCGTMLLLSLARQCSTRRDAAVAPTAMKDAHACITYKC
tara:strand:- start:74 stop:694 length:621 start_codon:yes stop_codon:yes gene_type:complete